MAHSALVGPLVCVQHHVLVEDRSRNEALATMGANVAPLPGSWICMDRGYVLGQVALLGESSPTDGAGMRARAAVHQHVLLQL